MYTDIYAAPTKQAALAGLETLDGKWTGKHAYAVKNWRKNWDELTVFFDFPVEIRQMIYTTNLIENINRIIRKYTKTKTMLPNDQAVEKVVYLALMQISKKWTMPIRNWGMILNQSLTLTIFCNQVKI